MHQAGLFRLCLPSYQTIQPLLCTSAGVGSSVQCITPFLPHLFPTNNPHHNLKFLLLNQKDEKLHEVLITPRSQTFIQEGQPKSSFLHMSHSKFCTFIPIKESEYHGKMLNPTSSLTLLTLIQRSSKKELDDSNLPCSNEMHPPIITLIGVLVNLFCLIKVMFETMWTMLYSNNCCTYWNSANKQRDGCDNIFQHRNIQAWLCGQQHLEKNLNKEAKLIILTQFDFSLMWRSKDLVVEIQLFNFLSNTVYSIESTTQEEANLGNWITLLIKVFSFPFTPYQQFLFRSAVGFIVVNADSRNF